VHTVKVTHPRVTGGRARRRAGRRTNLALLGLLFGAFGSGWLAFWTGTVGAARAVTLAHGALGLGLVLLVPWKSVIVRRSLRRAAPRPGRAVGVALSACLLLCLTTGVLHALDGYRPVLGVPALAVHVGSGVLAVPLVVVHAWGRRQRPRSADLSRRTVVAAGMLGVGSLATYGVIETLSAVLGLPGRDRRATGSYEHGSGRPDEMPVTQWFTDSVPSLDRESWQLAVGTATVAYADLAAGEDEVRAVLDCTSGWYAEQVWRGLRINRVLGAVPPQTRSIEVVSVTGYRRRFALDDLDRLLLATHAAGAPLSHGHGGPVRLVAPDRRGFWWVKWVQRVELSSEPMWLQPPFPLQ
jgi:hypothetical protein